MQTPSPTHTPGWYLDGSGQLRWHDGEQWTAHVDGPVNRNGNNRGLMYALVGGLVIVGVILNLSSVSLLTGTDKVWIGVGLVVLGLVFCFVPRRLPMWLMVVVGLVAAAVIANGVYDEVQLNHKRDQLEQIFKG